MMTGQEVHAYPAVVNGAASAKPDGTVIDMIVLEFVLEGQPLRLVIGMNDAKFLLKCVEACVDGVAIQAGSN